jgi:hypothetical protein
VRAWLEVSRRGGSGAERRGMRGCNNQRCSHGCHCALQGYFRATRTKIPIPASQTFVEHSATFKLATFYLNKSCKMRAGPELGLRTSSGSQTNRGGVRLGVNCPSRRAGPMRAHFLPSMCTLQSTLDLPLKLLVVVLPLYPPLRPGQLPIALTFPILSRHLDEPFSLNLAASPEVSLIDSHLGCRAPAQGPPLFKHNQGLPWDGFAVNLPLRASSTSACCMGRIALQVARPSSCLRVLPTRSFATVMASSNQQTAPSVNGRAQFRDFKRR